MDRYSGGNCDGDATMQELEKVGRVRGVWWRRIEEAKAQFEL
jgi:hypothetical protein